MLSQLREGNHHFSLAIPTEKMMDLEKPGYLELGGAEHGASSQRAVVEKYAYTGGSGSFAFGTLHGRSGKKFEGPSDLEGRECKGVGKKEEEKEEEDSNLSSSWLPFEKESSPVSYNPRTRYASCSHIHLTSRAKVIARCRREMVEMCRDLPEEACELTLKDLVELPSTVTSGEGMVEKEEDPDEDVTCREKKETKQLRKCKQVVKIESMERGGFLLKMFFPTSFLSGKKRRTKSVLVDDEKNKAQKTKPARADGVKCRAEKPKPVVREETVDIRCWMIRTALVK